MFNIIVERAGSSVVVTLAGDDGVIGHTLMLDGPNAMRLAHQVAHAATCPGHDSLDEVLERLRLGGPA